MADLKRRDRARLARLVTITSATVWLLLIVLGFVAVVGFVDANGKYFALTWLVLS